MFKHTVIACDKDGSELGRKDADFPHTLEDAKALGFSEADVMEAFCQHRTVKIQAELRLKTGTRKGRGVTANFRRVA